jgi:hypothetical protein
MESTLLTLLFVLKRKTLIYFVEFFKGENWADIGRVIIESVNDK